MSFPSVAHYLATGLTPAEALLAAVRQDCPEAVAYLHDRAHAAQTRGQPVTWSEDPNSRIGRQLIRIHASDAVRALVQQHVCHGQTLAFANCCSGKVGGKPPTTEEAVEFQIACQAGPVAYAD